MTGITRPRTDAREAGSRDRTHVVAIVGPTAVGKSDLAQGIACALGGEIVSADSMQVYRGMDVGTAKPTPSERVVPHHLLDVVEPGTPFSAALYQRLARDAIDDIAARDLVPVVCGGTGLYVRAALDDMRFPAGDQVSATRKDLEEQAAAHGADALHERLRALDPASAALIHPHNLRRTIRALEMAQAGTSYARQAEGFASREPFYPTTFIGLDMPRDELYRRIDARVDRMIAAGLLDEVRHLLERGLRDALTATQAIGYKEFVPVLENGFPLEEAITEVKQSSRRYAKRQLTWFRSDPRINWVSATEGEHPSNAPESVPGSLLDEALGIITAARSVEPS